MKNEIGERQDSLRRLGRACPDMLIADTKQEELTWLLFVTQSSLHPPTLTCNCQFASQDSRICIEEEMYYKTWFLILFKKMRIDCTSLIKPTCNGIYRVFLFVTILRESTVFHFFVPICEIEIKNNQRLESKQTEKAGIDDT